MQSHPCLFSVPSRDLISDQQEFQGNRKERWKVTTNEKELIWNTSNKFKSNNFSTSLFEITKNASGKKAF